MTRIVGNAIRYGLVGILNSAIGFLVIASVLYVDPAQTVVANATGYAAGFFISFALNRTWTFSDRRPFRLTLGAYFVLVAACYAANLAVVLVAVRWKALGIYLPQLLGMCTYTVLLFCGSHFIVFRAAPLEDLG